MQQLLLQNERITEKNIVNLRINLVEMKNKCVVLCIQLILIVNVIGCAKTGRPTGGPEDKDPPVMRKSSPMNMSTNFSSKEIKIEFDEYIKLTDINTQLIVSPPLKYTPIISPLGTPSKYVKIKILDTLKDNTTYTFNFGQSIIDNTEGNVATNFKYVFSTGDVIDSLSVSGTIKDAFNEEADTNVSIMMYELTDDKNDSIIYKEKPFYVANTLDTIAWEITNIKAGKYLLVAMNDVSKNYIFDPKQDKIGFHSTAIEIPTDSAYQLTLFEEILPYNLTRPSVVSKSHIIFGYEGIGDSIKVKPLYNEPNLKSVSIFEKDRDSLNYWYTGIQKDSLSFLVENKKRIDTVTLRLLSKEIDSLNITASTRGILPLRDQYSLISNIPLVKIDTSKISFMSRDSINVPYTAKISDSYDKILIDFEKKYKEQYRIQILPDGILDFLGNSNDTLNFSLGTKKLSDYGNVYFTIQNVKTYPIIVDLLDEKFNIIERKYVTQAEELPFLNLIPAKYKMRVIYDTNGNGIWDTGNYLLKKQPEKVIYYPKEIEIRANWDPRETFILNE